MYRILGGKVAIVTGGASGIGAALSEELALRGCEVVVADRHYELATQVEGNIERRGGRALAVELDVRDAAAFAKVAQDTKARLGRIDFLFNNAGIAVGGDVSTYRNADWDDVLDVNLRGVAYGIQAVYPIMITQRSGHIVNTASVAGLLAAPGNGSYAASKHAVVGLSRSLRIEAEQHAVRVSVLCPGAIRTPILTGGRYGRIRIAGITDKDILALWERTRPMAPEVFARKAVDRVLANEAIIVVPRWWKALWYVERLSPTLGSAMWRRIYQELRKELEKRGVDASGATASSAS